MIAITGATGQLGSATINFLINKGVNPSEITALVRSKEKAQDLKSKGVNLKVGNYSDHGSLVNAFKNTNKLLLISSNEMETRSQQHTNAINAAKKAGVKHIFYTSIQRKTDSPDSPLKMVLDSHLVTENAIKASGMKHTFLRNNLYMENLLWILGQNVLENGIFYPANEGRVAYATRSNMAEAAANILMDDSMDKSEYNISNSHSISFQEVADYLSELSGIKVPYISPDVETYKTTLTGAGVPAFAVNMLAGFAISAQAGELMAGYSDLPKILKREPTSYKDFLKALFAKAKS